MIRAVKIAKRGFSEAISNFATFRFNFLYKIEKKTAIHTFDAQPVKFFESVVTILVFPKLF